MPYPSPTVTTELLLPPMGLSPYASRGIHQTLEPIDIKRNQRRTVNGTLKDLSASQFEKYQSLVSCDDMEVPGLDGCWQGNVLTVSCAVELSFPTATGTATRTAVAGSTRTEAGFTFYRPILTMMVTHFKWEQDEWGAKVAWELGLEEV